MFFRVLEKFETSLKKITAVSFVFVSAVIFLLPKITNAQNDPVAVPTVSRLGTNDIETIVVNVINIALWTLGIISLVIILYAGFLWMTSAGNEEKIAKAKKTMVSAVIGLIIIFSSYAIVNFLLKGLYDSTHTNSNNTNTNNQFGFGFGSGALGGGVIEYHYPERDAIDVPRNTMIMITFKVEVATSSIVSDTAEFEESSVEYGICQSYINANPGVECGVMSDDIEIRNDIDSGGGSPVDSSNVMAMLSADGKNVILKPRVYLGSGVRNTRTSVFLKDSMSTQTEGALFGSLDTGYFWQFEVSTFLDLTPPQVTLTIPREDQIVARNIITQINFSEPINILSINNNINLFTRALLDSGNFSQHDPSDFELRISNRYRTVEVFSKLSCGGGYLENSCGEEVFCLPENSSIKIVLDSGDLFDPSSGINDAAGNFLDGNEINGAEGTPTDDYTFIFSTNDTIKLDAPVVEKVSPDNNTTSVNRNSNISASFNSTISPSSLNSNNFYVYKFDEVLGCNDTGDNSEAPFLGDKENIPFSVESESNETIYCFPNYIVYLNTDNSIDPNLENNKCNVSIRSPFLYTNSVYRPRVTAKLKDNYGNCFNFSFGPAPTIAEPNRKDRGQQ
ncbi:MAG: Ig-like domain-containing protein [Patescibacteria group bacterium]|nr:Ig-like domain-containing protein [Patescibacteria group bacterium]MDD4304109.1 Ig-like domain-containing protein [Patescibacteria group bacterium]MDD4694986.1 Ig-like domain-containing protein [Patescibacteria group bacterium]